MLAQAFPASSAEPAHLGFPCRSGQDPPTSSLLPGHFTNYLPLLAESEPKVVLNGMSSPSHPYSTAGVHGTSGTVHGPCS